MPPDDYDQYCAQNEAEGRPLARQSTEVCVRKDIASLQNMQAKDYSDGQMAAVFNRKNGKNISGPTLRRHLDRIERPISLRPIRMRQTRAKGEGAPHTVVINREVNEAKPRLPIFKNKAED
jgi:hypothetical protein